MKKSFLLFLLALVSSWANAIEVEIDGINYDIIKKANAAEVIQRNPQYSGVVVIPSSVTYEGVEYVVTSIRNAFYNCSGLTSITIPISVTSIGNSAFFYCTGLTSIIIPNSVTSIGNYTFWGCTGLTSVTIPNSVTIIGEYAFSDCTDLISITIPNSVTNIGYRAFSGCKGLTSITIPNSVTSMANSSFQNCTGLTSVTIPNSLTRIGDNSFSGCSGLTKITIGSRINSIESKAFANCGELKEVYCYAENVPSTQSDAFSNSYIEYATLYVPEASISIYRTASPWNGFKEIKSLSGGETPETKQCAKPTITYENGKIKCTCETENVTYAYTITPTSSSGVSTNGEISLSMTFNVSVYAQREGYLDSEVATTTISLAEVGDMNGDGRLSVEDVTKLVDVIMGR